MAQFDVHRNPGKRRETVPYLVVVQSGLFDDYSQRVCVSLVKASALGKVANPRFNPTFKIGGTAVVLHPLEIGSVPLESLGKPVGSLAKDGDLIIGALDDMFMRV